MVAEKVVISGKAVFVLSICILSWFMLLFLYSRIFKLDVVIISVIQEMFTLPIIVIQLLLVILAFLNFKKTNYSLQTYAFWGLVVLVATNAFVIGSLVLR
ncbi:MAG TPA: hypothetical protein VFW11_05625 [Cyclobacteriaceae bacterium]|nr:hypothetical protein [Cyclobacteriaceae bacterium]